MGSNDHPINTIKQIKICLNTRRNKSKLNDNVVIATKGLQDRNTNIIAGTTVENKGKLILIAGLFLRLEEFADPSN